jgi:ABC-type Fe3+/spermidine/putrescine transport system ATPase subunit
MIRIDKLNFSVGNFALEDISLHVRPGEYFVLLGPSGAGKTLLLECLCGLNRIDFGRISLRSVDVTRMEPRNRGIGYLPQDYALFPDRTVVRNILYGLESDSAFYARMLTGLSTSVPRWCARVVTKLVQRLSGRPPAEPIPAEAAELLDMIGGRHLAHRLPDRLSGGEKQRVALARALAVRPQVLLLDEPVSALDERTRDALCPELKRLQRTTGTTTIHVCHNFAEMLAVADRVGIIYQGRILQVGTPQEILARPRTRLVAQFVQVGNLFSARAEPDGEWMRLVCPGRIAFRAPRPDAPMAEGNVTFMVRRENVDVQTDPFQGGPPGTTVLEGTIRGLTDTGPLVELIVACSADLEVLASMGKKEYNQRRLTPGDRVYLAIVPDDVHVLED